MEERETVGRPRPAAGGSRPHASGSSGGYQLQAVARNAAGLATRPVLASLRVKR